MANILDYIAWRGDLTFTQDPPNAVDALIFSSLSYICYGGRVEADPRTPVPLRLAAEEFFALPDQEQRIRVRSDLELLRLAAESTRFGFSKIYLYRDMLTCIRVGSELLLSFFSIVSLCRLSERYSKVVSEVLLENSLCSNDRLFVLRLLHP